VRAATVTEQIRRDPEEDIGRVDSLALRTDQVQRFAAVRIVGLRSSSRAVNGDA
jgi:hypothetical protein